jgi:hypothetical protein
MTWGLIWLMLVLKIPLVALLWLVWWAVHAEEEPDAGNADGDGGTKVRPHPHRPAPRGPRPFPRHRGPHHGAPPPRPPARVRITVARGRPVRLP